MEAITMSEKLNEKLQSAKGQDWLNIRRIQLEVNKAHDNYLAEIPEDTKKANLRKIDLAMGNSRQNFYLRKNKL